MLTREQSKLALLRTLKEGRRSYAAVRAEYERVAGPAGREVGDPFTHLVERLIAEKLIDYEVDPEPGRIPQLIAALWLRPRGRDALGALEAESDDLGEESSPRRAQ